MTHWSHAQPARPCHHAREEGVLSFQSSSERESERTSRPDVVNFYQIFIPEFDGDDGLRARDGRDDNADDEDAKATYPFQSGWTVQPITDGGTRISGT